MDFPISAREGKGGDAPEKELGLGEVVWWVGVSTEEEEEEGKVTWGEIVSRLKS